MPVATKPGINYNPGIPALPSWAEQALLGYLKAAGLDRCYINSTVRTVEAQVGAMYDNEKAGKHIVYGAPGRAVIALINQMGFTRPKSEVVAAAAKLMREQYAAKPGAVSYHVADWKPDGFEAADISTASVQSKYSTLLDVLGDAKRRGELKELLYPPDDPALHVVLVRDKIDKAKAAIEHAATDGHSATYEGGSDESDHATAAKIGAGTIVMFASAGVGAWLLFGRRRK